MTENNAAQAAKNETAVEILEGLLSLSKKEQTRGVKISREELRSLLSKLRAEGVQAGDERMRKALQTLVDMYVLNQGSEYEQITCYTPAIARDLTRTQRSRNQTWKAWDTARAALASAPVAGEAHKPVAYMVSAELFSAHGPAMAYSKHVELPVVPLYAAPQASEAQCSCPSGDGSLRWPCAVHPQAGEAVRDAKRLEFMIAHGAWVAWSKDHELCRVFHRDDDGNAEPIMGWHSSALAASLTARDAIDKAMSALSAQPGAQKGGNDAVELVCLRDMLEEARAEIELVRESLGVPDEPHQTLFDRILDACDALKGAEAYRKIDNARGILEWLDQNGRVVGMTLHADRPGHWLRSVRDEDGMPGELVQHLREIIHDDAATQAPSAAHEGEL